MVTNICNNNAIRLSEERITAIYNKLYPYSQVGGAVKEQHIENIHNNSYGTYNRTQQSKPIEKTDYKEISESRINQEPFEHKETLKEEQYKQTQTSSAQEISRCPWCNGQLILRTAKKGANAGNQFYGCSNYPKCKYVKNIEK